MILERPERLLVIALFLLLFGCVMPFLMVIQVVQSTFFLNFLSFGASMTGMFLGIIGVAMYRRKVMKKDDEDYHE